MRILPSLPIALACLLLGASHKARGHGAYHEELQRTDEEIAAHPENAQNWFRRAYLNVLHGEWQTALVDLEKADRIGHGATGCLRGQALMAGGKFDAAKSVLDDFLANDPDHAGALATRARILDKLKQHAAALTDFRSALLKTSNTEPDLVIEVAEALKAQKLSAEAADLLEQHLQRLPHSPGLISMALDLEIALRRFDAALARVDAMQKTAPRPEPWMARRASVLAQAGCTADSIAAWKSLLTHIQALPDLDRGSHAMQIIAEQAQQALSSLANATPPPTELVTLSFTANATADDLGDTTASIHASAWSYSQNFDSMGTGTTPPSGWSFYGLFGGGNGTYTDSIPIPASAVGGGTLNNVLTALTTFTTSSNIAGFNYALPDSPTDRALGTSPTSGQFVALQLSLTNTSGAAISALRIGYDIRRFTAPASANELPGYWLFYSLDSGATWTNVSALNPTLANVPNTVGVTTIAPAIITLGGTWNDGADILFRWIDDNAAATSPDQIHGLDNVAITLPIGAPPAVALTAPTNGSVYVTPATVELTATTSDAEGPVSKIEFYQGATKLGESLTAPFTYTWSGVTTGNYTLTAVATDSDLNATTSSPINISVNATEGSGTLTRLPYLNQSNQNSIVIRWRTTQAVLGRVNYGTAIGSLTQVGNETTARTDHVVHLTGLTPYTRYYYSIGSAADTLAGNDAEHTFRTSPVPGTATDTRIWVVGDCGRGTQFQMDVRDAYYAFTGARTPDLCLMLGDNAYNSGTDAEYQTGFYNIYSTMFRKMPLWSCLGNHDANNGNTSPTADWPYFDMFTFPTSGECGGVASESEHYFSWDYGNIHFICLDSQTTVANNSPTAPQTVWLTNDLASTTKTWIITFFHHPPYSKGSHDSDTEGQMVTMRQVYNPILEAGGCDLVLVGHSHAYERSVLVDGHYDVSTTLTNAMKKNAGRGLTSTPGGAYIKPLTGPRDHFGTVYTVTGSAGEISGGTLNHPVMYVSYNTGGTFNIDINGNRLDATYIEKGATTGTFTTPDSFTMIKQGAADTDGDGVSDEFEIAHGMNRNSPADATLDTDFDGLDAVAEYLYDLDPGTNDRYAWATTRNPSTHNMEVAFATQPQRSYQVFYSHNLLDWFPASSVIPGDSTIKVWIDDGAVTGTAPSVSVKRFYKVEVLSSP